jgi:hypothetical protein
VKSKAASLFAIEEAALHAPPACSLRHLSVSLSGRLVVALRANAGASNE